MSSAFFADDPITREDQDQLGRLDFARQVASLCGQVRRQSETSVMALIGAWGSGKSSVLALVTAELARGEERWEVVEFNPWLLSDIDSLLLGFFRSLSSALPSQGPLQTAKKKLGEYAGNLAPFGKIGTIVGLDVSSPLEAFSRLVGAGSIDKQRDELATALRKLDKTILIVMDDLDRLHPAELLLVFKLIRLVGRLPNVHYLLAYDERTVLDLLIHSDLADGREDRAQSYLEKIVQLRLDLPPLHAEQQADLINLGIARLLEQYELTLADTDLNRMRRAYQNCLAHYLNQPRTINRFLAQADALYPLVGEEVNFADFLLMTFLRTFEPSVYHLVAEHRDELTHQQGSFNRESHDERRARWKSLLATSGSHTNRTDQLLGLLGGLFLPIQSALERMEYGSDYYAELARHRRVGSPDYFDRYVQFGVIGSDIADATVARALEQLQTGGPDRDILDQRLSANAGPALRKLQHHVDRGMIPSPADFITYLAGHYHPIREHSAGQFLAADDLVVIRLAADAFRLLPPDSLLSFVDDLLRRDLLPFTVEFVAKLHRGNDGVIGNVPSDVMSRLITALGEYFERLGQQPVVAMRDDDLRLLSAWRHFAGDAGPVREQLWRNVGNGWSLSQLMGKLVPLATSYGAGGTHRTVDEVNPDLWEDMLGLDRVITELGDLVDEADDEMSRFDDIEPTLEHREQYALGILKRIRHQRAAHTPPATDEGTS